MKIHYPRILNIKYKAEKFKNFKKLKLKKFKYGKLSLMTVQFSLPTFKSEHKIISQLNWKKMTIKIKINK